MVGILGMAAVILRTLHPLHLTHCPAPWLLHGDGGLPYYPQMAPAIAGLNRTAIKGSCNRDQVQGRGWLFPFSFQFSSCLGSVCAEQIG